MYKKKGISKNMKNKIIKPKHTSDEIKELFYGPDKEKSSSWDNPAYRNVVKWRVFFVLLFIAYIIVMCLNGAFFEYMNRIQKYMGNNFIVEHIESIDSTDANTVMEAYRIIWKWILELIYIITYLFILIAPIIPIPIKILNRIYKKIYANYIKKGLIYNPPIADSDFDYYYGLYKEAESMIPYLESSEIICLSADDENIVKMRMHDQIVSSEKKFTFLHMVHKIFQPDVIDFSVIDKEFDLIMKDRI